MTDWVHYNHGYTSNILNEPEDDVVASATGTSRILRSRAALAE